MEIKEIIAQFESKRTGVASDLSCLENLEKSKDVTELFRAYENTTLVLLDTDAESVKTVYSKYASVIEILKTGVNMNKEDIFHFAEYRVDVSATTTRYN